MSLHRDFIKKESYNLTKAAALKVIREVTGLKRRRNTGIKLTNGVIHIGEMIKAEVERQGLTQKEFGALISRNEKTVPDIYTRATISTDLLIATSEALNKDFLSVFYYEGPLKSLRNDEIEKLNLQIQKIAEENNRLQRELALTQNLVESQKDTILFAKEQIEHYKTKLTGVGHC